MKKINYSKAPDVKTVIDEINCFPRSSKRQTRIKNSVNNIKAISNVMEQNFENGIFSSPPMPNATIEATKDDMVSLYEDKFRPSMHYQKLLSASTICPICGIRKSDTIDHYFPKSVYFLYSVTRCNLVPICYQCNKEKLETSPTSSNIHLFHPYFDVLDEEKFLYMDFYFDSNNNFVPVFKVKIDNSIQSDIYKFSFETYKLKKAYELEAVKLFDEHLPNWLFLLRECGESTLKSLIANATSCSFKSPVSVPFQKCILRNFDLIVSQLKTINKKTKI